MSGWKIYLPDIGNYLYYPLNIIRLGNSKFYQEKKQIKTIPAAVTALSYIKELNMSNSIVIKATILLKSSKTYKDIRNSKLSISVLIFIA